MRVRHRWILLFTGAVAALVFVAGIIVVWRVNDRTDHPPRWFEIGADGTVTMDTYEGMVRGKLADVDWRYDRQFLQRAIPIISEARGNPVDGLSRPEGIWISYESANGCLKSLNKELQKLSQAVQE
jgi:hypothetical protein